MEFLPGGCRVFAADEGERTMRSTWTEWALIGRRTGARDITAALNDYAAGRSPAVVNPRAEEVLYIVAGRGTCRLGSFGYAVEPGTGVFVPPGVPYWFENPGPEELRTLSVCCPEDGGRRALKGVSVPAAPPGAEAPRRVVREREQRPIPVADREFKLMVDTAVGCQSITQFVGFIPPSKAPFHYHTYEEAIYILEGAGTVHVEGGSCAFAPGTSIYLPVGLRHCLENPGPAAVRLVGAFYPSGSPAVAYES